MNRIRVAVAGAILAGLTIGAAPAKAASAAGGDLNTDPVFPPSFSITSTENYEFSGGGTQQYKFTVTPFLGNGATTVSWTTKPTGSITEDVDYKKAGGMLSWAAGDLTSRTVTVEVVKDNLDEPNEAFIVELSGNILLQGNPGVGKILDDDGPMKWNVHPVFCMENDPSVTAFQKCVYTITRSQKGVASTVRVTTVDGKAKHPQDYLFQDQTLPVPANDEGVAATLWISTDNSCEFGGETLSLVATEQSHGIIANPVAQLTILEDAHECDPA